MSAVYQLKNVPERFMSEQTDVVQLAEQLGDEDLVETLLNRPFANESMKPYWGPVEGKWQSLSSTSAEKPDISLWDLGCLLLNQRAFTSLKDALAEAGEFLPITVDGELMYIFNCQEWGQEDVSLSERKYLNGYEDGLKSLVFEPGDVITKTVFKSKLAGAGFLYASESFKHLVDDADLQGLRFDTDLLDPF